MFSRAIALGSLVAAVFAAADCSSSSSGPSCVEYATSADLRTPQVSFKSDVTPILERACMFSSCHGGGTGKLTMTKGDPTKTRAALVDVAAPEMPSMKLVQASDPANSWMMHKLDGDVCLFKGKCTDDPKCDDTMPQGNELLSVDNRDTIRRWIAQGAKDN